MTTTEAPPVPYINLPLDTWTAFHSWVIEERKNLWYEFVSACRRAARPPFPDDPEHWSIEMLGIADRIQETDKLLGCVVEWRDLQWSAFPWLDAVSGTPCPDEAWQWLEDYLRKRPASDVPQHAEFDSAAIAMAMRPT